MSNDIASVRVVRAMLAATSGGVIFIPGKTVDDKIVMGCDNVRGEHIS